MKRRSGLSRRDDRGATALLVALLTLVLVGMLAFVSDLGLAYANQRRVQSGADAAALAVAGKIAGTSVINDTCPTIATAYNVASSRSYALGAFQKNVGPGAILAPGASGFEVTCETSGSSSRLVVKVTGNQDSPAFFGKLFGANKVAVAKSARAIVAPGNVLGVRPFAVCQAQANLLTSHPADSLTFSFGKDDGGCGGGPPGTFGLLDLDGSNSGGANDLKDRVEYGWDQVVVPFDAILSENGNEYSALPMDKLMDVTFPMPIFDSYGSAGKTYHGVGYVTVKACGWGKGNGAPTYTGGCYNAANYAAKAAQVGNQDWLMQVEYINYLPIAQYNPTCQLSDDTCDSGRRVAVLAD